MNAVVPMDEGIQDYFPYCNHWVIGSISPYSSVCIDNGAYFHIILNENKCIGKHIFQCTFNTFVVGESLIMCTDITDTDTWNGNGIDGKLRKVCLGIRTKQENCTHGGASVHNHTHQTQYLLIIQLG
ncbi:hypothetical protein SDC9_94643 [bioreactor metagenome]|uniref:Uncharacterized protein n=1 Tax=bioreactor metagenome TaxID=1076179 RepID=A0A645A4D1_9ZZZZ